jgi:hypothetical protein
MIGEPLDRTNLLFHCSTPPIIYIHERKRRAFILCYNHTRYIYIGSRFIGDKFRVYQHSSMKLLVGSRRPTRPVHAPIQPEVLEVSREFDAIHIRYVGKLTDSGLLPS